VKKKIFSIMMVLVLMLSFGLATAVPAVASGASVELQTVDNGLATWSAAQANSGSYSVELSLPNLGTRTTDAARVVVSLDSGPLLSAVDSLSFWWMAEGSSGLPYLYLALDTDGNSEADRWLIWNIGPADDTTGATSWTQWTLASADDNWHIAGPGGPYSSTGVWADMVADIIAVSSASVVVEVKVAIGEGSTNQGTPVYIDDIGINDAVYNLESSGSIDMDAPVLADVVSVSLSTNTINFPPAYPGDSTSASFTITNTGTVTVDLTAETNSDFYSDHLTIDSLSVGSWTIPLLEGVESPLVSLKLYIPHGTPAGIITGTLIIWVERSETQP